MNIITNLLTAIEEATGTTPMAFSSRTITTLPTISYVAYPQSDNAVIECWRMQTRITAETFEEAMEMDEEIRDSLVTLGAEEKHGSLSIQVNGGGTLEDETTGLPQLITYYDIYTKS